MIPVDDDIHLGTGVTTLELQVYNTSWIKNERGRVVKKGDNGRENG